MRRSETTRISGSVMSGCVLATCAAHAIRCETSLDEDALDTPSEEFARWLGHTLDIHKRVYLRFMTAERKDASTKGRYGKTQENPVSAGLSDEVLAKLAKLEQLEKLLNS